MTEHIVTSFEGQLQNLHNTIIKMGALAESQFSSSITALQKSDQDLVDKIIGKDDRVDEFEKKIEVQVIDLIALRQPLAVDLRETVSAMKISSELERIGDLSKNIAKRSRILKLTLDPKIATDIKNSAEFVQKNFDKKELHAVMFAMWDKKDYSSIIWKLIRPKYEKL